MIAARFRLERYRFGRALVHLGLRIMPDGPAKRELIGVIREWSMKVRIVVALHAQGIEARSDETRSGSAEGESPMAKPCAQGEP